MTKKQIQTWILNNCKDLAGRIDLSGLKFPGYYIFLTDIEANEIDNGKQKANYIHNDNQIAKKIYNDYQKAKYIRNNYQFATKILNDEQKAKEIYNNQETYKGYDNDNEIEKILKGINNEN